VSAARPKAYTTTIDAKRTAGECVALLTDAGADHVSLSMRERQPVGIGFTLDTTAGKRHFELPVNVKGVHAMLMRADRAGEFASLRKGPWVTSEQHALDVAWRVVRDWLDAQLALIAAELVTISEAFTAYRVIESGQYRGMTVAAAIDADEVKAIEG